MRLKSERSLSTKYTARLVAFVLLVVLAAALLLFGWFYTPYSGYVLENGEIDLTGYRRYDDRMIYLNGEWEYYPGQLIASEPSGDLPAPVLTKLPMRSLFERVQIPDNGKASFRILLTNIPQDAVFALSIPGYHGDYSVYLSGQLRGDPIAQLSPGFFRFTIIPENGGTTQELIIEIDQPDFFGFDKCPVLSDNDLQFHNNFGVRIVFFVFMGMLLFAYAILPFLYKFYRDKNLQHFAVSGCIALIVFILETIWHCGVLGYIEQIIQLEILYFLRVLVKLLLVFSICHTQFNASKSHPSRNQKCWGIALTVAMTALMVLALIWLPRQTALLVFFAFSSVAGVLMIISAVKGIRQAGRSALIPAVGNLAMLTGFLFSDYSVGTEATFAYQMVLPACLLIALVCWSLLIVDSHKVQIALLEKALTAEQATARTQAAFLASQIQPHFLYNTLTTIQELCYTDPQQAADTVVRFSDYLRQNIDFMEYKDKIPFSVELGHIENYIDIQRARFGDAIKFIQNIEFDEFVLPPLTVQPLIENSISHGIRKHNGQGTVTLSVRRMDRDIVITVTDDGEGFDVEAVHSRSLENIRCRIEGAMSGTVRIQSYPGRGTTVILQFPYKEAMIHADHNS